MNGDLSLSQTLGGLRIANPDNDVNLVSSSPPQTPTIRAYSSTTSAPGENDGRQTERYNNVASTNHQSTALGALGFDPSTYTVPAHPAQPTYPGPATLPASVNVEYSRFNNDRTRSPNSRPQEPPPAIPRNLNRNPTNSRPNSGLYSHPNISSGSTSLPESRYQRLRTESAQSSSSSQAGTVRRTNSRGGLAPGKPESAQHRTSMAGVFRQSSQSNHQESNYHPRPNHGYSPPSQPTSRNGSYTTAIPQANTEDWQGRGGVTVQNTVDQRGKPNSKVVKKGVKDFAFGRTLGEGSYSTVLAATDRQTSREFAIKVLDKKHIIKEKKVKYVNIEKDTLNRLTDHPGIVRLYYTFQDERSLYFVLDLAAGGELLGHLKKTGSFDEECTRFYGAQILDAVEYMHERGIIHRDLKPENVLLDDQLCVKITDFGTAKILDLSGKKQFGAISVSNDPLDGADTERANSFVGTAEYVSPELLTDKNACKASDLWAFGCIIFQLLAGRPPFKAANEYLTFQKIVKLEYSFPERFPPLARDLVSKLLVLDPSKRPNLYTIKNHPFFDGIEWGKGLWSQKPPRLKPFNPLALSATSSRSKDLAPPAPPAPPRSSSYQKSPTTPSLHQPVHSRPQPRIITELAPPTQLDIDWSPVLTKANERIYKLGQFVINISPTLHSPASNSLNPSHEASSKFSRFFGAGGSKKRQRLVLVTSGGRIILAPAGGDKKEAKQTIELTESDVSWRSQQDAKGYTVWVVSTRDKSLTFEDPRANTGDPGSSVRLTQEWLDCLDNVKAYALSQRMSDPNETDSIMNMNSLSPTISPPVSTDLGSMEGLATQQQQQPQPAHYPPMRKTLRNNHAAGGGEDETMQHRRKMFGNKRHSKNGLAAVF